MIDWFRQNITERGSKRPGENEGRPKQRHVRKVREEIESRDKGKRGPENERPTFVTEARSVGEAVAQSGAEGVRCEDGQPVKGFRFSVGDPVHVDRPEREIPN